MKKRLLIVLLCACSIGAFAQAKKPLTAKQKAANAAAARQRAALAAKKKAAAKGGSVATQQVPQQQTSVADTTSHKATLPEKPFDRPLDGYYKKSNIFSAKVTPYAPLREADVWMAKRVWEELDLREKMNNYLGSPKSRLIDVIFDAVSAGELTAYDPEYKPKEDPDGDGFSKPLKPEEARARLSGGGSSVVNILDKDGNVIGTKPVAAEFNPDSIVRFRIKEDWIFDKQRSVWEPRIIGIAPLVKPKAAAGIELDYVPAFWIYYPEARQVLATKEVASKHNDATGLSFDDVFMKRLYASYIVKESNDKNERIKDYAQGIDRLYESQRIKKALMDWELDLWQY